MLKGFAFKVLTPKDIAKVVSALGSMSNGTHSPATPDSIDKPTAETAASVIQLLAEYAYDMEMQHVKFSTHMPGVPQNAEIYEEALDVLSVFRCARQLALINHVEDFNFKDLWDPSSKRYRAVLSALINFCRYKESREAAFHGMKEELHTIDSTRLELRAKTSHMEEELAQSEERHNQILTDVLYVEQEIQQARAEVDQRLREKQSADRVVDDLEAMKTSARGKVEDIESQIAASREQVKDMQGQIADNPAGIAKEIEEQQASVLQLRAQLAETGDEKRSRLLRHQELTKLTATFNSHKEELDRVRQVADCATAAMLRTASAQEELAALTTSLDCLRNETAELESGVTQVTEEIGRDNLAHAERLPALEVRRQRAQAQLEELQEKRTEEQTQHQEMQAERHSLELELETARRVFESEINDFQVELGVAMERRTRYEQQVDVLMSEYRGDMSGSKLAGPADAEDIRGAKRAVEVRVRRLLASPSPARGRHMPPASPDATVGF